MADEPGKKRLSLDEILNAISEIAEDVENRDRFKALKMLASAESSSVVLPEPLNQSQVVERMIRLTKPLGAELARLIFVRCFPHSQKDIGNAPKLTVDDLSPEMLERVKHIRSLRAFYREFPQMKGPGFPRTFPQKKGLEVQQDWLRRATAKIYRDRDQARLDDDARRANEARDDMNPPPDPPA